MALTCWLQERTTQQARKDRAREAWSRCLCHKQALLVGQAACWQVSAWAVLCVLCSEALPNALYGTMQHKCHIAGHFDASSPCSLQPNGGPTESRLDCRLSLRAHIRSLPHLVGVDQEHTLCKRVDYWLPLAAVQHSCVHCTA